MSSTNKINYNDFIKYIETLPYSAFKNAVNHYAHNHNIDVEDDLYSITSIDLQKRLEKLNINTTCPQCQSHHIVKNGKRNHIQRYKCKSCRTQFTLFTNTILEKTKWHWNIWIKVMNMTLNGYSLKNMRQVLEEDYGCIGIDHKTVFLWRHKLLFALANMPLPQLSGIVQIDETFIREAQKGSRKLVSYIGKNDIREPRYGRRPSKYGVMGSEFATVTTAIDNTGHCVCKVTGLGKLTPEVFTDLFEDCLNAPAYICSDANSVYRNYCNLFNISHYEKPSNYMKTLQENGYLTPSKVDSVIAENQKKKNQAIKQKLYKDGLVDKITNKGFISFDEFKNIKTENSLNLGRVNELHADIKKFIDKDMTNVSTKYLSDYIGYFTYVRNWRVDNGHYPTSSKDAEKILIEILKNQSTYTTSDLKNTVLNLPKPSSRYMTLLKAQTDEARKVTKNEYFKFDEEDNVIDFDKRRYLSDQPKSKLQSICKEYGIKYNRKWVMWSTISLILQHPDINEIVIKLINQDRHYDISIEDQEYIAALPYKNDIA
jgi:transposase-like protein